MTSWTFRIRPHSQVATGASSPLTRVLSQAVGRVERSLRRPIRLPSPPDMDLESQDDETDLFRRHVGEARPLKGAQERVAPVRRPLRNRSAEPAPSGRETEPGEFPLVPDPNIERGSRIEFARPGLQRRELRRLQRGRHAVQDQLDLHGLFVSEAERAVLQFVERSRERGLRCVRIIHGKGRSSAKGRPVLKAVVDRWLRRCDGVLAFCPAPDNAGGTGAVHVLLRA